MTDEPRCKKTLCPNRRGGGLCEPCLIEDNKRGRAALSTAIDVFEGMNDDEIEQELLPRLRAALNFS